MVENRPTTSSGGDRTDEELGPASPKSPRLEQEAEQKMSGFRRLSGAALYKSTFQASWTKKWPFVKPVNGDKTSFRCTVCSKVLSCVHQGERDVTRHIATTQHQRNAKTIQGTLLCPSGREGRYQAHSYDTTPTQCQDDPRHTPS